MVILSSKRNPTNYIIECYLGVYVQKEKDLIGLFNAMLLLGDPAFFYTLDLALFLKVVEPSSNSVVV